MAYRRYSPYSGYSFQAEIGMAATMEFWFEYASTYSYLAAARVEDMARTARVEVIWRPFLLGPIFAAQGWRDSPFNIYPAKGRYMWRDMERLCAQYNLPFRRPSAFPRNGLMASRLTLVGLDEGWGADFARDVYRANFADDLDIGNAEILSTILTNLGVQSGAAMDKATSPAVKERLKSQTERALVLGIFGAPSFTVGEELFWGHDRLEHALSWAHIH